MTQENVNTIKMICGYAKSKKHAVEVFAAAYPEIPEREIMEVVDKSYYKAKENKYSLQKTTLKSRALILKNLLMEKELGIINKIFIPIVKHNEKKVPRDIYELLHIQPQPGKENYRGKYIELIEVSKDGIILICDEEKQYVFSTFDINLSKKIRLE